MMESKRELLFFVENYTGRNVEIKEMSHPQKHARTYMNRFTITEDDQYEISKIEEMDSDWGFKEGPRPENIHYNIQKLIRGITAESLDIFLFGWYEFKGQTDPHNSVRYASPYAIPYALRLYEKRIDIYNTLSKGMFHSKEVLSKMISILFCQRFLISKINYARLEH